MDTRQTMKLSAQMAVRLQGLFFPVIINAFISSGSSMLVYSASYANHPCVLKELFPEGLAEQKCLIRTGNGRIKVRCDLRAIWKWMCSRRRCVRAAQLNMLLQQKEELKNRVTHIQGVYRGNGSIYVLSLSPEGIPLNKLSDVSPAEILSAGICICRFTEKLHRLGWLVVDIKASNYILKRERSGGSSLCMTDFDSLVKLKDIRAQSRFMCSSETAPPELLRADHRYIGIHSDVYSIAAMLLNALARHPLTGNVNRMFAEHVRVLLDGWSEEGIQRLEKTLSSALDLNPNKRTPSCGRLADELIDICKGEHIAYESIFP